MVQKRNDGLKSGQLELYVTDGPEISPDGELGRGASRICQSLAAFCGRR